MKTKTNDRTPQEGDRVLAGELTGTITAIGKDRIEYRYDEPTDLTGRYDHANFNQIRWCNVRQMWIC